MSNRVSKKTPFEEEEKRQRQAAALAKRRATLERKAIERRAAIIREELSRSRAHLCRCGITPETTPEQLQALGAGCTGGRWVCDTLAAIRRRLNL